MTSSSSVTRFIRPRDARGGLAQAVLDIVGQVPVSTLPPAEAPHSRAARIARTAGLKASGTAGVLALAPGPLGWATIAPELYAVWKMQARMVSDIAACFGRHPTREEMLYCLFQHTAAGAFRDVVIQIGERYVVRRTPLQALYAIANKIALRIAQRGMTRVGTRWLPVAGAALVSGYVLLDTRRVAATATELFGSEVQYEKEAIEGEAVAAIKKKKAVAKRAPRKQRE